MLRFNVEYQKRQINVAVNFDKKKIYLLQKDVQHEFYNYVMPWIFSEKPSEEELEQYVFHCCGEIIKKETRPSEYISKINAHKEWFKIRVRHYFKLDQHLDVKEFEHFAKTGTRPDSIKPLIKYVD